MLTPGMIVRLMQSDVRDNAQRKPRTMPIPRALSQYDLVRSCWKRALTATMHPVGFIPACEDPLDEDR